MTNFYNLELILIGLLKNVIATLRMKKNMTYKNFLMQRYNSDLELYLTLITIPRMLKSMIRNLVLKFIARQVLFPLLMLMVSL